jgi:hypothetical protein
MDADGIAYVPTYYKSRIYIDMSDSSRYSERFEQLLRWIFDKPLIQKPELGAAPSFAMASPSSSAVGITTPSQRRASQAIREGAASAKPATLEYFGRLHDVIETMRLDPALDPFDDAVVESIGQFSAQRAEFVDLIDTLAKYNNGTSLTECIKQGFEILLPLMYRPPEVQQYREIDWDNIRFIVCELFLYAAAALIRSERFDELNSVLTTEFYFERGGEYGEGKMVPYTAFRPYLKSLEHRSERLGRGTGSRRTSIHADLLKERATGLPLGFTHLMQADFVLYLHGEMSSSARWWPTSLLYASRNGPFEIFARAKATSYFQRMSFIFSASTGDEFRTKVKEIIGRERVPQYGWHSLEVWELSGAEQIATKP